MCTAKSQKRKLSAIWKLIHYQHAISTDDPQLAGDVIAFRSWKSGLTRHVLSNPVWAKSFHVVASKEAKAANEKAARLAAARFTQWLQEGQASGLRRQHQLSRTATGWIASKAGQAGKTGVNERDELDGVSADELRDATLPTEDGLSPLAAQRLANSEKDDWSKQWAVDKQPDDLEWPCDMQQLPPVSLSHFKATLFSFANGTGLGWDAVHPRSLYCSKSP